MADPTPNETKSTTPALRTRAQGVPVWPDSVPHVKATFLEEFVANGGVLKHAAAAAGVHRNTINNWLKSDPDFFAAFQAAQADANDTIRREIVRRGVEGWEEEVYQNGRLVGTQHKYDSNLLMFLAKSRMPEFRDRMDITSDGQHVNAREMIVEAAQDADTAELAAQLLERVAGATGATPRRHSDDSDAE